MHFLNELALGSTVGSCDPVGLAVVVDPTTANHRLNRIAVGLRLSEPFEHHRDDRLPRHHAIGFPVEGSALPGS